MISVDPTTWREISRIPRDRAIAIQERLAAVDLLSRETWSYADGTVDLDVEVPRGMDFLNHIKTAEDIVQAVEEYVFNRERILPDDALRAAIRLQGMDLETRIISDYKNNLQVEVQFQDDSVYKTFRTKPALERAIQHAETINKGREIAMNTLNVADTLKTAVEGIETMQETIRGIEAELIDSDFFNKKSAKNLAYGLQKQGINAVATKVEPKQWVVEVGRPGGSVVLKNTPESDELIVEIIKENEYLVNVHELDSVGAANLFERNGGVIGLGITDLESFGLLNGEKHNVLIFVRGFQRHGDEESFDSIKVVLDKDIEKVLIHGE